METQSLTPKEKEVLELLSLGRLYKEIASAKNITIDTVKKHSKSIFKKLGVRNKVEAAIWWREHGQ